jgi:hypothetical protein
MPAHIKVLRLLGAILVTLALVPWLGVSPAAATGGGKGSVAAKGHDEKPGPAAKAQGNRDDDSDAKADKAKAGKAAGQAGNKVADRGERDDAKSGAKPAVKAKAQPAAKPAKAGKAKSGAGAGGGSSTGTQKVTLCHRTNADSNPYVRITVSINSVISGAGHDGHQGSVYAAGMKAAKQKWGDIIPAFSYPGGSYAGKNWPAGEAIFDAGCAAPGGGQTTTPPTTTTPGGGGSQKVTLCHRTNSETNPYVRITVSINSVIKGAGHDGHNGPIFAAGMKSAKQKWGDIIPSFTYPGGSYGGKNWPAGRAIFDAGCTVSLPTSTASGSPSPSPSGTVTVTTTVTGPNGTSTVTETVTRTPDTSVSPTKIGNDDDDTDVQGTKTGVLPTTGLGLNLGAAIGLSLLLLMAGGWLMAAPARSAERKRRH